MDKKLFCLKNVDLYEGISEKELIRLTDKAIESTVKKGTILYSPTKPAQYIYVIKEGEIELYREENGTKVVLETLFPGDVFGDFGGKPTTHFAAVARRSYLCQTPREEFLNIVRHHPEISFRLMQALAQKTRYYEDKITSLSGPARNRILDELRHLAHKNKHSLWGKMFPLPLKISHQKLAEKTGLNRVTVTKLLGELRNEGVLTIDEKTGEIRIVGESL
jgi:CRP/FNR family transcriptional regulator, cyclic AMP receptor protein